MVNEEVKNRIEFDDEPVAKLLRDLKRVDAPKDFDHRVRARIAQGRPSEKRRSVFPVWARAAIPAALLLGIGGYVGFSSLQTQPDARTAVAEVKPSVQIIQPAIAETPPLPAAVAPNEVASAQPSATTRRVITPVMSRQAKAKTSTVGTSSDSALMTGRTLELTDVPAAEALTKAGAKVSFDGTSMKVNETTGAAGKAGLKAGDVIESIDGRSVDSKSTVKGSAAGKKLRVRRDGKPLDIVIKN